MCGPDNWTKVWYRSEFESRISDVWNRHDGAVICTYHLGEFGGDTIILLYTFVLPTVSTGNKPSQIVSGALLDTLLGMLSLDLVYLRSKEAEDPLPR